MKLNVSNKKEIENYLIANNLELKTNKLFAFDIYRNLQYPYTKIKDSLSISDRIRVCKKQIDYIQKSVVLLAYEQAQMKAKDISCGYVYMVENKAWPGWFKVGSTIDVFDRISTYQTSSPHRDFEIVKYSFVEDRLKTEKYILNKFKRKSEWLNCEKNELVSVFDSIENYPELEILEFCLKEGFSSFRNAFSDRIVDKVIIKNFIKNNLKLLAHGLNEKLVLRSLESKFGVSTIKGGYRVNVLNVLFKFDVNGNLNIN